MRRCWLILLCFCCISVPAYASSLQLMTTVKPLQLLVADIAGDAAEVAMTDEGLLGIGQTVAVHIGITEVALVVTIEIGLIRIWQVDAIVFAIQNAVLVSITLGIG